VRIKQPFFLGTFPVTQAQWRSVVEQFSGSGMQSDPSDFKGDSRPVEHVSWDDCAAWCELIANSQLLRELQAADGKQIAVGRFGLPTEVQWEYACRAGSETEYYTGDGEAALAEAGWFERNSGGKTHPVGELAANEFGLYDMHGNVWEWCQDAWDADAYKKRVDGKADPEVSAEDVGERNPVRVIRGGSWINSAGYCRSAIRDRDRPDNRYRNLGFRVCLVPGPVPQPERRSGTES
jgi:formylglycine-generating enzyme required for sulfatase activity